MTAIGTRQFKNVIDADPVATAVRALMLDQPEWEGTATKLMEDLANVSDEGVTKFGNWPTSPQTLSNRLRRAATFLRKIGIEITKSRKGRERTRIIHITNAAFSAALDKPGKVRPHRPRRPQNKQSQ